MAEAIYDISNKREGKFLRRKPREFDFAAWKKRDIAELIQRMRKTMREANGVGLSANQIGVDAKVFVAEVPGANGERKFYAIFNPVIEKMSSTKAPLEEGCLSVPGSFGEVERADRITIRGFDKNGRPLKIKAWGLLARVFQHETDHLNGALFIDKASNVRKDPESERLKRRQLEISH